jgi:hypothetical protein
MMATIGQHQLSASAVRQRLARPSCVSATPRRSCGPEKLVLLSVLDSGRSASSCAAMKNCSVRQPIVRKSDHGLHDSSEKKTFFRSHSFRSQGKMTMSNTNVLLVWRPIGLLSLTSGLS